MDTIIKKTVEEVFGITDSQFQRAAVRIFPSSPATPKAINGFKFTTDSLRRLMIWSASASIPEGHFDAVMKRNLMIFGPTGCGKTQLLKEFCARTGRPMFRYQCSEDSEVSQLFGTWKLCKPIAKDDVDPEAGLLEKGAQGIAKAIERLAVTVKRMTGVGPEMTFVDGPVLRWARTPNAILLLDEWDQLSPTVAMSLNGILDGDVIEVPETGERIAISKGCLIAATGNTNGRNSAGGNGGSAALYKGVKRQNIASLDRFFVINATYLSEAEEKELLEKQVKVPPSAATAMASLAAKIRSQFMGLNEDAGANGEPLEFTITTRNLLNWGMAWQLLTVTGMDPQSAFKESLNMTLLDFGTTAERKAVLDAWDTIIGDKI